MISMLPPHFKSCRQRLRNVPELRETCRLMHKNRDFDYNSAEDYVSHKQTFNI